jgi:hypothetical protein
MKRLFGIILSLFGLIGLSPLLLALAIRIKKEDRGASVLPRGRENLLRFCFAKEDDVLDEACR